MTTCKAVMTCMEKLAPVIYAEKWDNVGLLVGEKEKEVNKVMVALDATDDVIAQAVEQKVDMLITHHPMIFSAMKRINTDDFIGRRIIQLIKNDISYYAMHTNLDVCVMNEEAAKKIGLVYDDILEVIGTKEDGRPMGIGMVGNLVTETTVEELAKKVKGSFGISSVSVTGDLGRKVQRVAISTGAGKSMAGYALEKGAQVFISGDMDHHTAIDMLDQTMQIIDAGHYGTEHFMVQYVSEYLKQNFKEELEVVQAKEKPVFIDL